MGGLCGGSPLPPGWVSAGQTCDLEDTRKECGGLGVYSRSCWAPTKGSRAPRSRGLGPGGESRGLSPEGFIEVTCPWSLQGQLAGVGYGTVTKPHIMTAPRMPPQPSAPFSGKLPGPALPPLTPASSWPLGPPLSSSNALGSLPGSSSCQEAFQLLAWPTPGPLPLAQTLLQEAFAQGEIRLPDGPSKELVVGRGGPSDSFLLMCATSAVHPPCRTMATWKAGAVAVPWTRPRTGLLRGIPLGSVRGKSGNPSLVFPTTGRDFQTQVCCPLPGGKHSVSWLESGLPLCPGTRRPVHLADTWLG